MESYDRMNGAFQEKPQPRDYSPGFREVLAVYPLTRKQRQVECWVVWADRRLEGRTAEIVEKIVRLKETLWKSLETRYIPFLKTYLDDAIYDDDLVSLEDFEAEQHRNGSTNGFAPQYDPANWDLPEETETHGQR